MNGYEMSIDEVGKALDAMVALDMSVTALSISLIACFASLPALLISRNTNKYPVTANLPVEKVLLIVENRLPVQPQM